MIKKLIWTIILLSPVVAASFISILIGDNEVASSLFNAGAAANGTWEAVGEFFNLFIEDKRDVFRFVGAAVVAAFFITPLLFVGRGLFFMEGIPFAGSPLRIVFIGMLILLPGVYEVIVANSEMVIDNDGAKNVSMYLQTIVLAFALFGLGLPKSGTSKK